MIADSPISLYVTSLRRSSLAFVYPSSMKCLMKYSWSSARNCMFMYVVP